MRKEYIQGDLFNQRTITPDTLTRTHLLSPDKTLDSIKLPLPYEPKMKNRWLVTFPIEFNLQPWVVASTQRPTINNISGNLEEIKFVFHDPIGPSTTQSLMRLYEALIKKTTDNKFIQLTRLDELNKFIDGFDYILEILDPTGIVVEKWEINGCKITLLQFGDLTYSDNGEITCTMWVQPKEIKLLY